MLCSRRLAAALGALLALAGCTSSGPDDLHSGPPGDKPSIVLVLGDDLSPDLVRFMPHVVDIQQSGTTLTHYFVTGADRTPLFTGRYPHDPGPPDASFAAALQRAGYRTALMGQYVAGYRPGDPRPPGWDEWDVASATASGFDYDLDENGTVRHYGHSTGDYLTAVLTAKAGDFIAAAAQDGVPFALVVAPSAPGPAIAPAPGDEGTFPGLGAPHGPAFGRLPTNPPTWLAGLPPLGGADLVRLDADYERRVEAAQALDLLVRRIGRAVYFGPAADSTYVVVTSDGGYHLGEHRMMPGSGTAFDTDIRVPLVVRGPGVPADATVEALASSIDLAPTLEELAGARPSTALDGTSLLSLWHGTVPSDWQQAVLVEHRPGKPVQSPRAGDPPSYTAVRTADSIYVSYAGGDTEYYDLTGDPDQLHNLAGTASAQQLAGQRSTLTALARCRGTAQCQTAARHE